MNLEILAKRLERERRARKEAEELLEAKSLELYVARQAAEQKAADLAKLNEALSEARDEAVAASLLKSRLIANMSHEVRTPLNAVLGYLDDAIDWRLTPSKHAVLVQCQSAAEQLLGIVNDVLDLSKKEADVLDVHVRPVSVNALVRSTCEGFREDADVKRLTLKVELDGDDAPARLDPTRLRRILIHLISNAIKYTHRGSVTVRLSRPKEGWVLVEVQDTGPGIDENELPRLFRRFQRGAAEELLVSRGVGLGLPVVRTLVDALGGEMGVETEIGVGSKFWFALPAPQYERVTTSRTESDKLALSVLVVDDDRVNRLVIRRHLSELGCGVVEAASGEEAIVRAEIHHCDVVLMDLRMPGMDGLETCRRLRRVKPDLPVVACSASVLEEDRKATEEVGMVGFLAKPVRRPDLRDALWDAHLHGWAVAATSTAIDS